MKTESSKSFILNYIANLNKTVDGNPGLIGVLPQQAEDWSLFSGFVYISFCRPRCKGHSLLGPAVDKQPGLCCKGTGEKGTAQREEGREEAKPAAEGSGVTTVCDCLG